MCIVYLIFYGECRNTILTGSARRRKLKLLNLLDVLRVDDEGGASEMREADDEFAGAVGFLADFTFEATEVSTNHSNIVIYPEYRWLKFYRLVRLTEHEFQLLNLFVANNGDWLVESAGIGYAVNHEAIYEGQIYNPQSFPVGAFYKNN